jgi:hypothetical protein
MVLKKNKKYGLGIAWKILLGHWHKPNQVKALDLLRPSKQRHPRF